MRLVALKAIDDVELIFLVHEQIIDNFGHRKVYRNGGNSEAVWHPTIDSYFFSRFNVNEHESLMGRF
jgi:hypothetical protein